MDLSEFRAEFLGQVAVWASADSNFRHSAFVDVAVQYLEDAGEVFDFTPCYFRGVSRRRNVSIDGYAFDVADGSLRVFLAESSRSETTALTQTEASTLFNQLRAFIDEAIDGKIDDITDENSPARAFADEFRARMGRISKLRAYLLTGGVLSSRVKDWPEDAIRGIPVEFHIWDISRFLRAYSSRAGRDDLVVDFAALEPEGIPCLAASDGGGKYGAYLCVLPGHVLADIYDEYGSRLLEGNVRAFLSTKGRINKGIRNTVLHESEMFFAYNNGIAATASSVVMKQGDKGLRLLSASDLQIVNGGQTTASLAFARKADAAALENVFVPMKLSVVEVAQSADMIPKISRFANSQNKVSDADFFANHPYHRRMELISRRLWAPARRGVQHETHWFYERARGQYTNEIALLGQAERRRFAEMNPRSQVVTKTDLAKSENSWFELPHKVSRGAQSNFIEFAAGITRQWETEKDVFGEEYFRATVSRAIMFREIERVVSKQAWYSGGYRANVVTYALAKLAHEIKKDGKRDLDFRKIWQEQRASDALTQQLAVTAECVYEAITKPPPGHVNVTQWCKREECWERIKRLPMKLYPGFVSELADVAESQRQDRLAREQQHLDSGIDAQAAVALLGEDYWRRVLSWAGERHLLTPEDESRLRMAAGFRAGVPSDRSSRKLMILKGRLEQEGLAPARVPESIA